MCGNGLKSGLSGIRLRGWNVFIFSPKVASAIKETVSKAGGDSVPHIICGDFNSPPLSPGYLVARDGYPSGDETITKLQQIKGLQLPEGKVSVKHEDILLWLKFIFINTFPNKPWFLPVCSTSLLKTLWVREKLLVTNNFSFSYSVFQGLS